MSDEKLILFLEYLCEKGRICPNPQEWQELSEMLPDKQQVGLGWNPPLPVTPQSKVASSSKMIKEIDLPAGHPTLTNFGFYKAKSVGRW